ncbi:hypothetical protein P154DRAFT_563550 [Amniculicola lignicola CBS 123094]|uniref:Uncharacterized protein n=1 Tax=Amniculicola lignicola CBS 123094 TaxID=1392246 RepID=A0A6A5WHK4_9PLEO|nr:hypothetical protein P154DRAFT_563550 [Amniculicola lignicola CBS 123094]
MAAHFPPQHDTENSSHTSIPHHQPRPTFKSDLCHGLMESYQPSSTVHSQERLAFGFDRHTQLQPFEGRGEHQGSWSKQFPNHGIDPHLSGAFAPMPTNNTAWAANLPMHQRWSNNGVAPASTVPTHGDPFARNSKYQYTGNSNGELGEDRRSAAGHGNTSQLLTPPRDTDIPSPTPGQLDDTRSSTNFPSPETDSAACRELVPLRRSGEPQGNAWSGTRSSELVKGEQHLSQANFKTYRGNSSNVYHPSTNIHQTGLPLSPDFEAFLGTARSQPTYVGMEMALPVPQMHNAGLNASMSTHHGASTYLTDFSWDPYATFADTTVTVMVHGGQGGLQPTYQNSSNPYHPHHPPAAHNNANRHPSEHSIPPSHTSAQQRQLLMRTSDNQRHHEDKLLLEGKAIGLTYKEIRKQIGGQIAESTLRGRYRSLTKQRKDRVRKPHWTEKNVELLREFVLGELNKLETGGCRFPSREQQLSKISWKRAAEYIKDHVAGAGSFMLIPQAGWHGIAPTVFISSPAGSLQASQHGFRNSIIVFDKHGTIPRLIWIYNVST